MTTGNRSSQGSNKQSSAYGLNRRDVLRAGAGLATGAALGRSVPEALAHQSSPAAGGPVITIPAPVVELPTENVTLRWVDSGDVKAFFWRAFFEEYTKAHPNITIEYQPLPWNEIAKVVPLGVRNGNAPDVFQIPQNVPASMAVSEGWGAAYDDFMPNFAALKKTFPPGVFVPGITDFNGKTYIMAFTSNRRHGNLLLYNLEYMQQAGYDPAETPFSYDQFREVARKLTEQGAGNYYGLIFEGAQTDRFSAWANALGTMSGRKAGFFLGQLPFDWKTGEFVVTDDAFVQAIELLMAMRDDGSIFPGSISLNAPQARSRVPEGSAAMIVQGPWNVSQWKTEAPDFRFGVAQTPVMDTSQPVTYHVGPGGSNPMWTFADSQLKPVVADIFSYIGSLDGQKAWAQIVSVADPALFPEAQEGAGGDDPEANKVTALFKEEIRLAPDPRIRNPETAMVYQVVKPVQPDYGSVIQGLFTGQLENVRESLQSLQDAWNAEFDRSLKASQDAGAQISRDDFVFPNWDPGKDYSDADYAVL